MLAAENKHVKAKTLRTRCRIPTPLPYKACDLNDFMFVSIVIGQAEGGNRAKIAGWVRIADYSVARNASKSLNDA